MIKNSLGRELPEKIGDYVEEYREEQEEREEERRDAVFAAWIRSGSLKEG